MSVWKALKNTDLSKTCMCVLLTEFGVCTWVTDWAFSGRIYGPMQARSKCASHKSEGKTKFCNFRKDLEKEVLVGCLSYLWVQTERKDFNSCRHLNLAGRLVKNGLLNWPIITRARTKFYDKIIYVMLCNSRSPITKLNSVGQKSLRYKW